MEEVKEEEVELTKEEKLEEEIKNFNLQFSTLIDEVKTETNKYKKQIKDIETNNKNKDILGISNKKNIVFLNERLNENSTIIKTIKEDIKIKKNDADNFYEIATELQNERIKKRKDEQNSTEHKIKNTYAIFELYCRAFEKDINLENFKTYRKENKINFWIAKKISEQYFGLKFMFDYKKNKWLEVI